MTQTMIFRTTRVQTRIPTEEDECGTDQYDSDSTPVDYDSNGVCDANDPIVEPEPDGTPGFGLLSALTVLALAAFARRD